MACTAAANTSQLVAGNVEGELNWSTCVLAEGVGPVSKCTISAKELASTTSHWHVTVDNRQGGGVDLGEARGSQCVVAVWAKLKHGALQHVQGVSGASRLGGGNAGNLEGASLQQQQQQEAEAAAAAAEGNVSSSKADGYRRCANARGLWHVQLGY